jgi:NAD(P)-dependent dehydrogenase (short-subunit alcohol dehydrogenase family)
MIIITGASKGVGEYLFGEFKKLGQSVVGTYNTTNFLVSDKSCYYKIDITDYKNVSEWVLSLKPELDKIILINCAGISYNSFAHKADISLWNKVIEVNLNGTFNVIHSLLPIMRDQNYGRIINFSSVVTSLPTVGISAYMASKSAINGLTKVLAKENASKGITVNAINLGYSSIGMGISEISENHKDILLKNIPVGRFCEPIEILNTVNFIIDTEYINGSIIDLNGGLI